MRLARWGTVTFFVLLMSPVGITSREGRSEQLGDLRIGLEASEREAAQLRARLEANEDNRWLARAEMMGVTRALLETDLTERQRRRVATAITREATANELDPLLLVALIRSESGFDAFALSARGAMGLMQVTPGTGSWLASHLGIRLGRTTNLFDSDLNVQLGTAYLARLIRHFGSLDLALVAYNAGPTAARKILASGESRARFLAGYPRQVLQHYRRLKREHDSPLTTREWESLLGHRHCRTGDAPRDESVALFGSDTWRDSCSSNPYNARNTPWPVCRYDVKWANHRPPFGLKGLSTSRAPSSCAEPSRISTFPALRSTSLASGPTWTSQSRS